MTISADAAAASFEADRASIKYSSRINLLKTEHEAKAANMLDDLSTQALLEAFKIGFEAGFNSRA